MLEEAERRLEELKETVWRKVAEELRTEDDYQFVRAYSPGLQEWVEALSFYHFLRHEAIISHQDCEDQLTFSPADSESQSESARLRVSVPQSEYVLGLADLTGELMRNAINALGSGDMEVGQGWPRNKSKLSHGLRSESGTLTLTFSGLFHSAGDPPNYGRGVRPPPQAGLSRASQGQLKLDRAPISGQPQGDWPEGLHSQAELSEGGERLLRHRSERIGDTKEPLGRPFL